MNWNVKLTFVCIGIFTAAAGLKMLLEYSGFTALYNLPYFFGGMIYMHFVLKEKS